jgi:hypothetical protein
LFKQKDSLLGGENVVSENLQDGNKEMDSIPVENTI